MLTSVALTTLALTAIIAVRYLIVAAIAQLATEHNSRDPADLQICSAELNFQFGLFLDFIDKKPAHLADPHQMIEGQSSNDEEKHQRCAEESEKLESFSHAENDVSRMTAAVLILAGRKTLSC